MKKGMVFIVCALLAQVLHAQTFSEWFRQKKTQKKYLIEQIAALKVYADFAARGYKIGREGLSLIGRIKDGDFNLHRDFFGSLKYANPEVRKYPRVADILRIQEQIMTTSGDALKVFEKSSLRSAGELAYCRSVYRNLYEECDHDLALLEALIGPGGKLNMTDDERLSRIDGLYSVMGQRLDFTHRFSNGILFLIGNRERELGEITRSKIFRDLK